LFEGYSLDTDRRELRRGPALLPVEPQVFDLLVFLLENRDRVVSKDDLLASVWSGRIVSESTIASRINAVRRLIGDDGEQQRLIRTIIGKGIRFVGAVRETSKLAKAKEGPRTPGLAILDRPSIAVLAFGNLTNDPEQEYFAHGVVEEIIAALFRIKWLAVVGASAFANREQPADAWQVGSELGVRYVLEGSVRKSQSYLRITAELIETATGAHLWADRFDGLLEDVFELQDRVARSVAGVIEPALQAAEIARSAARPTADLTAFDLYVRAITIALSSEMQMTQAIHLLEHAIERDPHYGPALAWAADCYGRLYMDGLSKDPESARRKGADLARRALEVAGDDASILANAALALARFGEDVGAMMALVDRALGLNPSFARGWYVSGALRLYAGHPDIAIEHVSVAQRLSPRARVGMALTVVGAAHFVTRRFDEALSKLLVAIREDPAYPEPHRYLAACYAHLGRLDEARAVVERVRATTSDVVNKPCVLRNAGHRELYLSGLRLAAGEVV
jgi:TolB-like protein/Tfp pilus assembly protein PilF